MVAQQIADTYRGYRWQVDGVTMNMSALYGPSFSLQNDQDSKTVDIQLRVQNSVGNYDYETFTITIVREHSSYYYLTDHLGSVRVTVDDDGNAVGWDDYYPFGLQMPGRTQNHSNPHEDIKFTGYELEQQCETDSSGGCINDVTLGLYHAEARMYDPVIGRFMQSDPMTGKYPRLSPYTYVANNPLVFVYPTGMVIEICNGSGDDDDRNCVTYEAGMGYEGDDEYMGNMISRLNEIHETESGKEVLGTLIETDNIYSVLNEDSKKGAASYDPESRTLSVSNLIASDEYRNYDISHELFHSYQHELGFIQEGERTINAEVGGFLFGEQVMRELGHDSYRANFTN